MAGTVANYFVASDDPTDLKIGADIDREFTLTIPPTAAAETQHSILSLMVHSTRTAKALKANVGCVAVLGILITVPTVRARWLWCWVTFGEQTMVIFRVRRSAPPIESPQAKVLKLVLEPEQSVMQHAGAISSSSRY
jgi:hypothetical protein